VTSLAFQGGRERRALGRFGSGMAVNALQLQRGVPRMELDLLAPQR
jgi:hypothetical protein